MDKELYDLLDDMTADELMPAGELLEEMAENTTLPKDTGSRIRASVLQKAGFKMNNTIRMNKGKDNINNTDISELNTVRRGHHIIAACAALAFAAAGVGTVLFGSKLNTAGPGSEITKITETAESTETAETEEPADSTETLELIEEKEISQPEDNSQPEIGVGELSVIPDVKGMSAEEAEKALSDAGYVPVMRNVFDKAPKGEVVSTSPVAGQKLGKGIEVECCISIGDMDPKAESPELSLWDLTDEEAKAKIEEAGFVPERVEVFSAYYPVGKVCDQESDFGWYGSQPLPGSKLKYYVSGSSETTKNIPDFNKVVYEDERVVITADKLLSDGKFFIMHLTEETKDGTTIDEFREKWGERLRYADTGERVPYIKGMGEERVSYDSTAGGAYLSWVIDDTVSGYELTVDLVDLEDNETYMSETSEGSIKRESFTLDANIPTRTLTSDNGLSITLSPMGISWASESKEYLDEYPDDPFKTKEEHPAGTVILTKDGRRIRIRDIDYYLSQDFGMSTGREVGNCYYAYKDIDEVEAVELLGIIYK